MPTVVLSNPLESHYAQRLGLAVRDYEVGESIVLDTVTSQFLEYVGYGVVTGEPSPGAPLLFGSGAPANSAGANGSYYLDTASQTVYGPKVGGSWPAGVPLADSAVLIGGLIVAPEGPKGDKGDPGPKGDPGSATNVTIRAAGDYDNTTAPSTGQVVRWNGTKFAPASLAASDVGAVALTGAQTVAGVKTFSSAPVVPAPSAAGNPVRHDDGRLTNARTPTSHAASHAAAGSDPITPTAIGAAPDLHGHTPGSVGAAPAVHTHPVTDLEDSTATGRALLTAGDGPTAREAIGALAATWRPAAADVSDASGTGQALMTAASAAAARNTIAVPLGTGITEIRALTQQQYDGLATKSATTLYVIQG